MADTTAAPDGTATGNPAPADAGAQAGSTPSQQAAEAVGKEAERVAYLEAELKRVIGQRDEAKKRFFDSDEGKALVEKARRAEEYEKSQAEAERKAAEQRGEWKQILEKREAEWTAKSADYEAKVSDAVKAYESLARKHKDERARAALSEAYQAAGGIDLDAFLTLAAPKLTDGSIAVGDDGAVKGHGDVVKSFLEKRGYLFRTNAEQAMDQLAKHGVVFEQQPQTMQARDAKSAPKSAMSLTEYQRALQSRQGSKPTFPAGKTGG